MIIITRPAAFGVLFLLVACAPATGDAQDIAAIESLMRATWQRPDASLDAGPIVVEGDYAIADWTQGEMGGRALLQRRDGAWRVALCAGDGLRTAEGLQSMGVERRASATLARILARVEENVPAARLEAMFGKGVRSSRQVVHVGAGRT